MTTPADEALADALHRADTGRLAGLLDPRDCPPAVLELLLRHGDQQVRLFGLALLTDRLAAHHVADGERAELARLLPAVPPAPPEAALLLAGLYRRLAPQLIGRPRPPWREAGLPAPVRLAWLRAELLDDPAVLRREPPGELLHQAVRGLAATEARRPDRLVAELAAGADGVLHAEALRLARQGLHAGVLAPALVRTLLAALLDSGDAEAAAGALRELAEPWAVPDRLPAGRLAAFLTTTAATAAPGPAEAALTAAARHGHPGPLRRAVEDRTLPPALRRRALELLGGLAGRADIGALTAVAASDPLLLAGPALTCLRGLHRRGHFAAGPEVPAVLGLALADHGLPAGEVATVLFTSRQEMFRWLLDAPADDPDWPRRLDLLIALAGQGATGLPIGEAVTELLPAAPDPRPFLRALRALRHAPAEAAVLAALPAAPPDALETLEAVGGPRTVSALRAGLGLDPDGGGNGSEEPGVIAAPLRAVRHQALALLWHLTEDTGQRRALLERLDPVDLPARIAADLGGPDERELALLSSHLDQADPVAALCRLAAHGSAATLPVIGDLLLRVVTDLAASRAPDAPAPAPAPGRPAAEPTVPQEVLDAVGALGARLHARRRIRPVCLLDAPDGATAGHALTASLALDLLDRPGRTAAEQAVLLELLLRAPSVDTRARVHRLLRHRDRHVRKHVIALLARDATGEDARALSATLVPLTTAPDPQTVRQALLALGRARAHWAGDAVAACLDHPVMNVRKTAAEVLARTGTPATVPALLRHLGGTDNPSLRGLLVQALRAVLGDAYPATLLAAAEQQREARARDALLAALDGVLPARSLPALESRRSPLVTPLLALIAAGRIAPARPDGLPGAATGLGAVGAAEQEVATETELVAMLARHGHREPAGWRSTAGAGTDTDLDALLSGGWDDALAARIAARPGTPRPAPTTAHRSLLADWLRLARSSAALRRPALRFALHCCPAPWTEEEGRLLARFAPVLLAEPAGAGVRDRPELLAALDTAAPLLSAVQAQAVTAAVRALPPGPTDGPATLALLRRCGAVPLRADVERALAGARLGPDPWRGEPAVLREAFGRTDPSARPAPAAPGTEPPARYAPAEPGTSPDLAGVRAGALVTGAAQWRAALTGAVGTPAALAEFRQRPEGRPGSRDVLDALIQVHHGAGPPVRAALLDWMTELQPLGAPPWTLTENAQAPAPAARTVRAEDLDQPDSAALRGRLLAGLESPAADRREAAATALLRRPEPAARIPVLLARLRGRVDAPAHSPELARTLSSLPAALLRAPDVRPERVALLAVRLDPWDVVPLLPMLLEWWEVGPPADRPLLTRALRRAPADVLAGRLDGRLAAGAWGVLDLLAGQPLLRTPELARTCRRLHAEGREDLAAGLRPVDGPLRAVGSAERDAGVLAALRGRSPAVPARPRHPSRRELLELARTGGPEEIRRALIALAEHQGGRGRRQGPEQDGELLELLTELLRHPLAKVRLRAHRTARALLDRSTHLGLTAVLLDDPQPEVVRTAVRTLCRAGWAPAAPAVAGLLEHPHPAVRRAAAEGLAGLGASAVPALRRAADHARPDRRARYTEVLDRIVTEGGPG
ncbi:hypothetical protein GCM10010495_31810 [Kitasatospora herbaricolor]|uniref:HEAT repeat domain-containing protein n=1 Tax=Kitasatospora herbaricolor TaxID=68217 RepID=UPI00174EAA7F|nr:HEAT repeat domain-containing protein [Kitasatospora herbaricolor]MDQ0312364.1 HEAT repeat protein [Kitasatospora herbaricolor]GGV15289.1 hypothetical protein GCM10010495_31810 [Kitasatospora herbaricolor]